MRFYNIKLYVKYRHFLRNDEIIQSVTVNVRDWKNFYHHSSNVWSFKDSFKRVTSQLLLLLIFLLAIGRNWKKNPPKTEHTFTRHPPITDSPNVQLHAGLSTFRTDSARQ